MPFADLKIRIGCTFFAVQIISILKNRFEYIFVRQNLTHGLARFEFAEKKIFRSKSRG